MRVASLSFSVIVNRCNLLQARPDKQNNPISQLSCFPLVSRRPVSEAVVGREKAMGGSGGWFGGNVLAERQSANIRKKKMH